MRSLLITGEAHDARIRASKQMNALLTIMLRVLFLPYHLPPTPMPMEKNVEGKKLRGCPSSHK